MPCGVSNSSLSQVILTKSAGTDQSTVAPNTPKQDKIDAPVTQDPAKAQNSFEQIKVKRDKSVQVVADMATYRTMASYILMDSLNVPKAILPGLPFKSVGKDSKKYVIKINTNLLPSAKTPQLVLSNTINPQQLTINKTMTVTNSDESETKIKEPNSDEQPKFMRVNLYATSFNQDLQNQNQKLVGVKVERKHVKQRMKY
jgi:hypothetical protein